MSERLPNGTFDRLGSLMWEIGQLSIRSVIESAPAPCDVQKEFHFGRNLLTAVWELERNPITGRNDPLWQEATIAEAEAYGPNTELDIYFFRTLALDLGRRRKQYTTGAYISNGNDITITPRTNVDVATGQKKDRARNWQEISRNAGARFGVTEAERFIDELTAFGERIKHGS